MDQLTFRHLGLVDYLETWQKMKNFVQDRASDLDEIWFCEHPSIFTVGRQGNPNHLLNPQEVPVIFTDRGGEVTYHGPGQIVVYPLIHLRKRGLLPKAYLAALENSVIAALKEIDIDRFCRTISRSPKNLLHRHPYL